jgi:chemotaxis signal transduction protein
LPCHQVREVHRAVTLAAPIGEPPAVAGHVNLRGQVARVLDLRVLLGQPPAPIRHTDLLFVAESDAGLFVLLVERAIGLMELAQSELASPPPSAIGRYVADADGLMLLLDPEALLTAVERSSSRDEVDSRSPIRPEAPG